MIKKILIPIIFIFVLLFIPPTIYFLDYSQTIDQSREKVPYNLPYPGILPDHPLYFIKVIRDQVLQFKTRENINKAELYLLLSDKRVSMAIALAKKGKDQLAITTFSKAEKYFSYIPELVDTSKKQGVGPQSDFLNTLKLSSDKHREVTEMLMKELPQGSSESMNQILKLNSDTRKKLEKL
jgi:hypothetical protein